LVKAEVERYCIYLADLDPTRGREIAKTRPVVVVSQESMNRFLDTVVVCPLTTRLHPRWRSRIQITCARRKAEIAVDQIRAISKERLGRRLDSLDAREGVQLRRLITEMYGE
jgi:mRNA interferase MazF